MKESQTGLQPKDSDLVRVWKDSMDREAAQIRSQGGTLFIKGQETPLPVGGYKPTDFISAELEDQRATYLVSIMFQRPPACDNGANSSSATQVPPVCPIRVTVLPKNGSKPATKEMAGACGIQPSLWETASRDTGTFVRLAGDRIEVEATDAGKLIPGCSLSVPLN